MQARQVIQGQFALFLIRENLGEQSIEILRADLQGRADDWLIDGSILDLKIQPAVV